MRENTTVVRRLRSTLLAGITVAGLAVAGPVAGPAAGATASGEIGIGAESADSAVLGPRVPTRFVSSRITGRWSSSIRHWSRSAVEDAYQRQFVPSINTESGWSGSVRGCRAGATTDRHKRATQSAINFVRSLNGLGPVNISPWMSGRAQKTALMMEANDRLSHYPTSSWRCHTWEGDVTAAKSNIALSYPSAMAGRVVDMYMDDRGWQNTAVGHRRWLLYPFTVAMGVGSTDTANAVTVRGPSSSSRPNPRWTSWPSKGYFPGPLEPAGRWSLSSGLRSEDFSRAVVRLWKNGVRIYPRRQYRVVDGYGMPTIAWQMPGEKVRRGVYKVQVAKIRRPGVGHTYSHTYTVRIFSPR